MTGDDAARREAAQQLRAEHPKWLVIWIVRTQRFHAYLLASSRAETSELTDTEATGLADQMQQAEHAAASRRARQLRVARQQDIRSADEDAPADDGVHEALGAQYLDSFLHGPDRHAVALGKSPLAGDRPA